MKKLFKCFKDYSMFSVAFNVTQYLSIFINISTFLSFNEQFHPWFLAYLVLVNVLEILVWNDASCSLLNKGIFSLLLLYILIFGRSYNQKNLLDYIWKHLKYFLYHRHYTVNKVCLHVSIIIFFPTGSFYFYLFCLKIRHLATYNVFKPFVNIYVHQILYQLFSLITN